MDAHELLISWPGLDKLDASSILSHPAWRMPVGYEDEGLSLVANPADAPDADELLLKVSLDEVDNVLGISDSPDYPDLHRLWARRAELPGALVIALVEKEAGALLQTIEKFMRGELRIVGLASRADAAGSRRSFALEAPAGSRAFSIHLPSAVETAIGVLDNLDPAHPSIASLTRGIRAEYAALGLPSDPEAALAPGDYLVSPNAEPAAWKRDLPDDDVLRIVSSEETAFTFGQFVTDALPPVPPPGDVAVFRRGRKVATAVSAPIGDATGFLIKETFNS